MNNVIKLLATHGSQAWILLPGADRVFNRCLNSFNLDNGQQTIETHHLYSINFIDDTCYFQQIIHRSLHTLYNIYIYIHIIYHNLYIYIYHSISNLPKSRFFDLAPSFFTRAFHPGHPRSQKPPLPRLSEPLRYHGLQPRRRRCSTPGGGDGCAHGHHHRRAPGVASGVYGEMSVSMVTIVILTG